MTPTVLTPDTLHRTAKAFADRGEVSIEAAYDRLAALRLAVHIGPAAARTRAGQATLLTAVNAADRCLLGGVFVSGALDVPLSFPVPHATTLADAAQRLGARTGAPPDGTPAFIIGETSPDVDTDLVLAASVSGWNGGVLPDAASVEPTATPIAGVAAGAIAVSEVFQHLAGFSVLAARRPAGVALWAPGTPWQRAESGPDLDVLPQSLWIVGLGHLGQAYLWTLSCLPYADPSTVSLTLQDDDRATNANRSTSPLTFQADIGRRKTRIAADWMEACGMETRLIERRLDAATRAQPTDPQLALFGVDSAGARSLLDDVGFNRVVDAGLGSGDDDFLDFQLNGFPGPDRARDVWADAPVPALPDERQLRGAYRDLAEDRRRRGLDACGVVQMAGAAVGASFVGLTTSALVVAETIRLTMGEPGYAVIDGSLDDPSRFSAVGSAIGAARGLGFSLAVRG